MTGPEDRTKGAGAGADDEAVARMKQERARLSTERDVSRRQRRRGDQQLIGWVMICAVVCFAVGLFIAKVVWKPHAAPGPQAKVGAASTDSPTKAGVVPGTANTKTAAGGSQPTTPAVANPSDTTPEYNITERPAIPISDRQSFTDHMVKWRHEEPKYLAQRWARCLQCIEIGDLKRERVKAAFLATPREKFCRSWNLDEAYAATYMDIHYGVTISGPNIVCRMTDRLDPQPSDRCLEIGTGSGYQSAFLANLSNHVYSIEIIAPLLKDTQDIYTKLIQAGYDEYRNVHLKAADGYYGWEEYAPFNKIIVTCAIDHIPPPLLKQLAPKGVMIIPIGPPNAQRVLKITKVVDASGKVSLTREDLYPGRQKPIVFVPFTAEGGGTHFQH